VGRALSWSLAAHAVFILSFLLLSATRQPLTIPTVVRPVRLITYLEPKPAPRQRAAAPAIPESPRAAAAPTTPTAPVESRVPEPPAAPATVPRVVIPVRGQEPPAPRTPAPPADARPDLSERLARRLASAAPPAVRPTEIATPQLASLPPAEPVPAAPIPDRAAPGPPAATPGAVVPVGYFPHAWYLAVLKEKVFARWTPPSEYFKSSRPPTALVSFRIARTGGVSGISLKESSGSARFDASALAAVQGLGQVPALPEQYAEESLDVVIRFQNQR
jgi:TonB family protein